MFVDFRKKHSDDIMRDLVSISKELSNGNKAFNLMTVMNMISSSDLVIDLATCHATGDMAKKEKVIKNYIPKQSKLLNIVLRNCDKEAIRMELQELIKKDPASSDFAENFLDK